MNSIPQPNTRAREVRLAKAIGLLNHCAETTPVPELAELCRAKITEAKQALDKLTPAPRRRKLTPSGGYVQRYYQRGQAPVDDPRFELLNVEYRLIDAIIARIRVHDFIAPYTHSDNHWRQVLSLALRNGNPEISLNKLLIAPDSKFLHDVLGIAKHISFETGRFDENGFKPLCAIEEEAHQ